MIHLREAQFGTPKPTQATTFPFTVPTVAALAGTTLAFPTAVTFFIGENGSGKSTLLEALACAAGSITVGSAAAEHDPSLRQQQALAKTMKLVWQHKTRRGFFMRSEDFFGYARQMQQLRAEMEQERQRIDDDPTLSPTAKAFGKLPYSREIGDMQRRYGASLDAYSHGESFFTLFQSRFVPDGLYLLDEPEAPLSPMRQLALISMLKMMVTERNAQFIIATHSPILMAFPDAVIYTCEDGKVQPIAYAETEHFKLTRDFLQNPQSFLRHL